MRKRIANMPAQSVMVVAASLTSVCSKTATTAMTTMHPTDSRPHAALIW
jgi:hypothetical protein